MYGDGEDNALRISGASGLTDDGAKDGRKIQNLERIKEVDPIWFSSKSAIKSNTKRKQIEYFKSKITERYRKSQTESNRNRKSHKEVKSNLVIKDEVG